MSDRIAGHYEVVRKLGQGTRGVVFHCRLVRHPQIEVAVRVFYHELIENPETLDKVREGILASFAVHHPNALRSYEYLSDGNLVLTSMEYAPGGNLMALLESHPQLPVGRAVRILRHICRGLDAIHQAKLVHGNLKPENILFTARGFAMVADYAPIPSSAAPVHRPTGRISPVEFIPPEYLQGGAAATDARSDLFSLGVLAYHMLTGAAPFARKGAVESMVASLSSTPKPIRAIRSECPPALEEIVLRALARNPDDRYPTVRDLYADLERTVLRPAVH